MPGLRNQQEVVNGAYAKGIERKLLCDVQGSNPSQVRQTSTLLRMPEEG